MKITKSQLKQIIKEELSKVLEEDRYGPSDTSEHYAQQFADIAGHLGEVARVLGLYKDNEHDRKVKVPFEYLKEIRSHLEEAMTAVDRTPAGEAEEFLHRNRILDRIQRVMDGANELERTPMEKDRYRKVNKLYRFVVLDLLKPIETFIASEESEKDIEGHDPETLTAAEELGLDPADYPAPGGLETAIKQQMA